MTTAAFSGVLHALTLAMGVSMFAGCLDDLEQPNPVSGIRVPTAALSAEPGQSVLVTVQAVDTNKVGVNGAKIAFARTNPKQITFDGQDDTVEAVSATAQDGEIDGISAQGVASVRVRAPNDAPLGTATLVAILRLPSEPTAESVSTTVSISITKPDGGTTDGGAQEAASDGESAEDGGDEQ